ncbi:hypothetical protein Bca101_080694 [Brassica carinata]
MKNAFQPSRLAMFTILLFGVMTMAQKEKPKEKPLVSPCTEVYLRGPGRGKCDATSCKSECARKRKGIGLCYNNEITDPTTQVFCRCMYLKNKMNTCVP